MVYKESQCFLMNKIIFVIHSKLSRVLNLSNVTMPNGLVKMSANWSLVET